MQSMMVCVKLAVCCALLLFVSGAVSVSYEDTPFTEEETKYLTSIVNSETETYSNIDWKYVALAFSEKRGDETPGFDVERSSYDLALYADQTKLVDLVDDYLEAIRTDAATETESGWIERPEAAAKNPFPSSLGWADQFDSD